MKFIVNFKEDATLSCQFPVSQQLNLVEATQEYLETLRKEDIILDWGFHGTGAHLYFICEVKNTAQLYEIQELVPLRPICKVEGHAVLEGKEFAETLKRIRKNILNNVERAKSNTRVA